MRHLCAWFQEERGKPRKLTKDEETGILIYLVIATPSY